MCVRHKHEGRPSTKPAGYCSEDFWNRSIDDWCGRMPWEVMLRVRMTHYRRRRPRWASQWRIYEYGISLFIANGAAMEDLVGLRHKGVEPAVKPGRIFGYVHEWKRHWLAVILFAIDPLPLQEIRYPSLELSGDIMAWDMFMFVRPTLWLLVDVPSGIFAPESVSLPVSLCVIGLLLFQTKGIEPDGIITAIHAIKLSGVS
ncbi:uncharacterized protein BT62DRAFT_306763 [Guyanagaster necrorhizus]|uniref:Uncharacterized protein n=1 Tax=Guyanagaster necrorhizus TaxID=856835 RepID=A0A9P8ARL4_9AGAR|nr:uncharacterized protein BT62DRAFT_306763 [Guyanagaster necrorhizus MCA 3950]KAG7443977.1 hypothetical protein BT62DRAFT_306763 [Guyanagaster necrorhizus MCA 3950]